MQFTDIVVVLSATVTQEKTKNNIPDTLMICRLFEEKNKFE